MNVHAVIIFIYLACLITGVAGYILNIIALISSLGAEVTTMFIARCVGLFIPFLGAILGFC